MADSEPQPIRTPWALCFACALPAALLAIFQLGRLHPDEVYQALEPAYFKAFGYGVMAWEWTEGIRNWSVPLLLAGLLKVCIALGIEHPQARRAVLELPQYALHAAMLGAVFRIAARRVEPSLARWSIVLLGSYGLVLSFAGRTMSESYSAAFLVLAFERLDKLSKWRALAAGALLGLSVVTRYGSAVFVAATLGFLVAKRRWKELGFTIAGGIAVALALGALDWATWGKPFHSFFAYLQFNVVSGRAEQLFGAQPPRLYFQCLPAIAPWAWVGLIYSAYRARKKQPALAYGAPAWAAAIYFFTLLATPHKEERFMYPAFVLLAVAFVAPALSWLSKLAGTRALALAAATGLLSFFIPSHFTVERPEQFRFTVKAGREAKGLVVVNEGLWGAGGFFYVGKNVPWFPVDEPVDPRFQQAMTMPEVFNRAVTWDGRALKELQAAGFQVLEVDGKATLLGR